MDLHLAVRGTSVHVIDPFGDPDSSATCDNSAAQIDAIAPGSRFGLYEVVSLLGAGGMGEVYRAHDARLGRAVAIKLLPEAWAEDADRTARLEREARVLASLNHPHIAAVYGFDEAAGRQFLVMELVEGETLADRLTRGPLSVT